MSDIGKYRKVYTRLWRHPGFAQLTDAEKTLTLYLLSGPQTNRLGLYMFSIATAAEDLGMVPETLKRRLVNVTQTFGWMFDARARVLFIPSWFRWNQPENVNVMKGNLKDLHEIPPCGLIDAFARNLETLDPTFHETFIEGLRQRLPKGPRNQEPYPDPDPKRKQETAALRAGAENETPKTNGTTTNLPTPNAHLLTIALAVVNEHPNAPPEHQRDALQARVNANGNGDLRKQEATQLIHLANITRSESRTA